MQFSFKQRKEKFQLDINYVVKIQNMLKAILETSYFR
jgi:hypothetical protein